MRRDTLIAEGIWADATMVSGALAGGEFYGLHDRNEPSNPLINPYATADGRWLMLVTSPPHAAGLAQAIGHPELREDPRFTSSQAIAANSRALTEILERAFASQPLAYWKQALDQERITYAVIQTPEEAAHDPQLRPNDIVVPLEGVAGLDSTIGSPITVLASPKVPARRAPGLGEHNDEVLAELGFSRTEIDGFRSAGVIPPTARPSEGSAHNPGGDELRGRRLVSAGTDVSWLSA